MRSIIQRQSDRRLVRRICRHPAVRQAIADGNGYNCAYVMVCEALGSARAHELREIIAHSIYS